MALPLMPARAGRRRRVAVGLLWAARRAGARRDEPAGPGGGCGDPFAATVAVDATADNVATARDMARTDGERRALAVVAARLAGGSAPAKLPKLDDNQITDLVASFEVANERMSAVRYVGRLHLSFQAGGARAEFSAMPRPRPPRNPGSR